MTTELSQAKDLTDTKKNLKETIGKETICFRSSEMNNLPCNRRHAMVINPVEITKVPNSFGGFFFFFLDISREEMSDAQVDLFDQGFKCI